VSSERRLRVLFDLTAASGLGGVDRWSRSVFFALASRSPDWSLTGVVESDFHDPRPTPPNVSFVRLTGSARLRRVASVLGRDPAPVDLAAEPDVVVGPAFVTWKGRGVPEIPVIHDLAFLRASRSVSVRNLIYLRALVPRVVRRAARIVTVSHAVKEEICAEYRVAPERVDVVPGAPTDPCPRAILPIAVDRPFILCVAAREPRKNLEVLLEAHDLVAGRGGSVPLLVIVGGPGWRRSRIELEEGVERRGVLHLGLVDDATLSALYREASALVCPSTYEGFGLPVVEALSHGCPVVVSDIPALREVAGSVGIYVDPQDPSSVAEGIFQALEVGSGPRLSGQLRAQATGFSWDRSAELLEASIERAVSARA
jgi:glycosyltransferase involved in cell wall biosynthesis